MLVVGTQTCVGMKLLKLVDLVVHSAPALRRVRHMYVQVIRQDSVVQEELETCKLGPFRMIDISTA